jgi:uncharacterized membrane protein YdbT with pleckstrin-like domain
MGYVESLMGKNEQIIVLERKHWTTMLMSFLVNLFLIIVIVALYAVLGNYVNHAGLSFLPVVRTILLFALLFPVGRFGWDFVQWEAEQYLVTSRRVMQTEGIINKKTTDSSLEKVNDIILTQSFLGRILGYGDLEIITGSDAGINLLKRLAEPVKFKTALLDAKASMHDPDILLPHESAEPMAGALLGNKPKSVAADDDDPLKRIAELDNLRKSGAISDAEYQSAKARLLSKL